jgi:hypothetical protein
MIKNMGECWLCNNENDLVALNKHPDGYWELLFWGYIDYDDDGYNESEFTVTERFPVNYCPICGKKLK